MTFDLSRAKEALADHARNALQAAVRRGKIVRPKECQQCLNVLPLHGHHHKGYERSEWLNVEWLCLTCHRAAHGNPKPAHPNQFVTRCVHGHDYTPENTGRDAKNGRRFCRACKRKRDSGRDPEARRAYYAAYYQRKRAARTEAQRHD